MPLFPGGLYLEGVEAAASCNTHGNSRVTQNHFTLKPLPFTDSLGTRSQHGDKNIELSAINTYLGTSLPPPSPLMIIQTF